MSSILVLFSFMIKKIILDYLWFITDLVLNVFSIRRNNINKEHLNNNYSAFKPYKVESHE